MSDLAPALPEPDDNAPALGGPEREGMLFYVEPYQVAPVDPFHIETLPVMSAGRKRTMAVNTMIALGKHPMGGATRPGAGRCGNCANLRRAEYHGRHYLKCALTRWTHGPGTDIRRGWPACERWQAITGAESAS